jgi:hypothetical protein
MVAIKRAAGVQVDAVVARHVDDAPEVQRGVEHRQGLVFRHVDLVQHAEAAALRAAQNGALAHGDPAVGKRVRPDEGRGVRVDVKGDVPLRPAEHGGQVLRQDVLAGGLGAHQQQILPGQQRRGRRLPNFAAVVEIPGLGHPILQLRLRRPGRAERPYFLYKRLADALFPQKIQQSCLPSRRTHTAPQFVSIYHILFLGSVNPSGPFVSLP